MKIRAFAHIQPILAIALMSVALMGCGPKPGFLTYAPSHQRTSMKAAPNEAVVVFTRPSFYGAAKVVGIIDTNRRFIGEVPAGKYLVARVQPGMHRFVIWPRFNSVPINASLKGGHTYYVEVGFAYKTAKLFAVAPRTKQWHKLRSFLTTYQGRPMIEAVPNLPRGQAEVRKRKGWTTSAIKKGQEEWADLDADEIALHTLYPNDGLAQPMPL